MKKRLPIILSVLLLAVLAAVTLMFDRLVDQERLSQVATIPEYTRPASDNTPVAEGDETAREDAPNITVYDAQGNAYTLEEFRGKPVVLNFWASWSGPSANEMLMFQSAYDDYKEQVHFLMINAASDSRETRENADRMIENGKHTFPVYYDTDGSALEAFSVVSLPTSFFIDANGKAIAYAAGQMSRYDFERGLALCYQNQEQTEQTQGETTPPEETTESTEQS